MSLRKTLNPLAEQVAVSLRDEDKYFELWNVDGGAEEYPLWNFIVNTVLHAASRFEYDNVPGFIYELKQRYAVLTAEQQEKETNIFFRAKPIWKLTDQSSDDYQVVMRNNILFLLQNVYMYNPDLFTVPAVNLVKDDKRYKPLIDFFEEMGEKGFAADFQEIIVGLSAFKLRKDSSPVPLPFEREVVVAAPPVVAKQPAVNRPAEVKPDRVATALQYTSWILAGAAVGLAVLLALTFFHVVAIPALLIFAGVAVASAVAGGGFGALFKFAKDKLVEKFSGAQEKVVEKAKEVEKPQLSEQSAETSSMSSEAKAMKRTRSSSDLSKTSVAKEERGRERARSLNVDHIPVDQSLFHPHKNGTAPTNGADKRDDESDGEKKSPR